ncbi:MAG TPA: hypothetical protein VHS79_04680, partial [Actinomycetes bacterium]|nr:hypothetical protein [Actinomycetes bacterium]
MQLALLAVLAGVMLAVTGAGQAWARVSSAVELPGIGSARLGGAEALRRGARWPALGDAFRAPPDRAQPAGGQHEPPW